MDKGKLSAIIGIVLSACIALAALWGYNIVVVQPIAEQVEQNTADIYGVPAQGGARAVGDTGFTNIVTTGDATVGGNLNVTGTASITGGYTTGTGTVYEGATANDYETTLAVVDPTADRTLTLPNETAAVMVSSLVTNGTEITNSVTGASNALVWEGATADGYETSLSVTDPTADRSIVIPNGAGTVMLSSLATNAVDVANAVTGASNALVFEGVTANNYETLLAPADPGADVTLTLPAETAALMVSSLTTNATDAANAVTGASNGIVFEGATADGYETTVTPTDPTADRTITLPNIAGTVMVSGTAAKTIFGSQTITGTATVTHGLTTPLYAFCTLAGDSVANSASCSTLISSSTVTVKVWKGDGSTEASAAVKVDWMVVGTP